MQFRAFVVRRTDNQVNAGVEDLDLDDLPQGDVLVRVECSAVNYKDGMVTRPGNRVARISPLVPGVDLAGIVERSASTQFPVGSEVIVHGYGLGVSHHGGFAELARVPSQWVVPLPIDLGARRAMVVGTAGFAAVLSLHRLQEVGLTPQDGPVLVTGASGGVGSMAVATLAHHGYSVVASTGKADEHAYLRALGASDVIGRVDVTGGGHRVLGDERWAGAVDCVGGSTLAEVLRNVRYGGAVAASGLTGGSELATTVYPFIVRNVALLGVDSVATPIDERRRLWASLGSDLPVPALDAMVADEIGLDGISGALEQILAGAIRGRVLVRPGGT